MNLSHDCISDTWYAPAKGLMDEEATICGFSVFYHIILNMTINNFIKWKIVKN